MNAPTSYAPALGRLLLAAIFLFSGLNKLLDPAATIGYINAVGLPLPEFGYALAVIVEIVGSLLLIVGYQARIAALSLAILTLVAGIFFHSNFADQNQFIHFMKNLAIVGGLLQVVTFGAGRLSVDARRAVPA
ncbi:MAG: DoxX family protein [Steroidobacteraceae bacterium]